MWGPSKTETINHKCYYILFTDDYSHKSFVFFIVGGDEALSKFCKFKKYLATQNNVKIKHFQSDGGGEYLKNSKII